MVFHSDKHHRRSIRLQGYDYSQAGAYFVTVVTWDRACLFGDVVDGEMRLNDVGQMVAAAWDALSNRFPIVALDAFAILPNHVHGIVVIATNENTNDVGAGLVPAHDMTIIGATEATGATTRVAPTVGDIVGAFKSLTTVHYTRGIKTYRWPPFLRHLWQRNYYEHIIRNEESLNRIREYIVNNPIQWDLDRENPVGAIHESPLQNGKSPSQNEEPWRI